MLNGVLTGFLFGLLQQGGCCTVVTTAQLASTALSLAAMAFLVSVFVLCVVCRFTFASVAFAALINAVLVAFAVVFVLNAIGAGMASPIVGVFVGLVVGLLVGWILCLLCDMKPYATAGG
jgi:hypothetical protein